MFLDETLDRNRTATGVEGSTKDSTMASNKPVSKQNSWVRRVALTVDSYTEILVDNVKKKISRQIKDKGKFRQVYDAFFLKLLVYLIR